MNNPLDRRFVIGGMLPVDNLYGTAFTGEEDAHTFRITAYDGSVPAAITGQIAGKFVNPAGVTVPLSGSLDEDGRALVTLDEHCYVVEGQFILTIWADTQVIYCGVGRLMNSQTETVDYPTAAIPDVAALIQQLQTILNNWPADYSQLQSDVSNLKSFLSKKAVIEILNEKNLLIGANNITYGYYYWTSPVLSASFRYYRIPVTNGETYKICGARFVSKDGAGIINDQSGMPTPVDYTADFSGDLILSYQKPSNNAQFFCKASDYDENIGSALAPTFNPSVLAQTDGELTGKPVSQKLFHDTVNGLESKMFDPTTEDGVLSPLAICGITYAEGSSIVLPPWTVGKYAYASVGSKILFLTNNDLSYIKLSVNAGRMYYNMAARFSCVCDANDYVLVAKNADTNYYVDIPEGGTTLYITIKNESKEYFRCGSISASSGSDPSLIASFDMAFPGYEEAFDLILLRNANKFSKSRFRESACKVGAIWYTTGQYANYDTYWFIAEANKQYTFGCETRFFTVNDTLLYSDGTIAGFTYTPEEECVVWVCISKRTTNPIKCVEAPTTLNEVNPAGIMTPNPAYIAQTTGNSPTLLMSQKAITEALNESGLSDNKRIYGKGYATAKGNLNDGEVLTVPKTNVKKNNVYSFLCKITSFSSLLIGHGETDYESSYVEITTTEIIRHNYYTSDSAQRWSHGLTISEYLNVQIQVGNGTAKIQIFSNGASYSVESTDWGGDSNANSFAKSVGSVLTDCVFTWSSGDFRKFVWAFGDSYFGFTGNSRWPYYLAQNGYLDNVLLNAYPGEGTLAAIAALNNMITHYGCPKFIVWCLGMNDGTDTDINTPSSTWMNGVNTVISLCEVNGITPIFATIPSVPGRTGVNPIYHEGKNKWIRDSEYRYIDFAKAVGATWDGENTTWYSGMISSDGVHPDTLGALALYYRAIADAPEFTYTNP